MPSDWEIVEDSGSDWEIVDEVMIPEIVEPSKPVRAGMPRYAQVEEEIKGRKPYYQPLMDLAQKGTTSKGFLELLSPKSQFIDIPLAVGEAGWRGLEGIMANIGLAAQEGKLKPTTISPLIGALTDPEFRKAIGSAVKGERMGQLGDIPERIGVPKPVSSAIGLLSIAGLTSPSLLKGGGKFLEHPILQGKKAIGEIKGIPSAVKGGVQMIKKGIKEKIAGKKLTAVRKEIKSYQEQYALELPKEETVRKMGEQISERRKELFSFKKNFDQIIDTETKTNAVNIKPKLREFGNNLSKSYDKGIDEIDSLINVQNKTANIGEVGTDWLENALNKVSNDPEAVTRISTAARKQGFVVNEMLDDFGDKIYRVFHPEKMGETVSFRELINFKNMFKKNNLSSTAKSGVGFQRQDMAYRALQDSWGDFILKNYRLASNEPTEIATMFTQLQKEYAPLANAKWKAFKIFKPYDIEAIDIQKGMKFFKDYTLNKGINELEGGSVKLLDMIEKGSEFSPGIGGDTSSRLKSLGDIKIKSEKDLTTFISGLLKQKEKVTDLLAQEKELVNQRNNLLKILGYSVAGAGVLGTGVKITGKILQER